MAALVTHGDTCRLNGKGTVTPEYCSWRAMRARCLNPKNKGYVNYGGRGITICQRWSKFENFLVDMGRRPTIKHTLERNNNSLGYYKNNCCWATKAIQGQNRRSTKLSRAKIAQIKNMYVVLGYSQEHIASVFGVRQPQISRVLRQERWV